MKERKKNRIYYYDEFITFCMACLGLWGGFLLILFAKRSMKEFGLGWGYDILLFFAVIGFAYLIITHYPILKSKKNKIK